MEVVNVVGKSGELLPVRVTQSVFWYRYRSKS